MLCNWRSTMLKSKKKSHFNACDDGTRATMVVAWGCGEGIHGMVRSPPYWLRQKERDSETVSRQDRPRQRATEKERQRQRRKRDRDRDRDRDREMLPSIHPRSHSSRPLLRVTAFFPSHGPDPNIVTCPSIRHCPASLHSIRHCPASLHSIRYCPASLHSIRYCPASLHSIRRYLCTSLSASVHASVTSV
jgi:hypothetical protein